MRPFAPLAILSLMLGGCAGAQRSASAAREPVYTASCVVPRGLWPAPLAGEAGVYRTGSLALAIGEDLAQVPVQPLSQPSGSDAIAMVTGNRTVTVRADPGSRAHLWVEFALDGQGQPAGVSTQRRTLLRFPACGQRVHRFLGGVTFAGTGCARLIVTTAGQPPSTMLIPVGNSLAGCSTAHSVRPLPSASLPFLGVACGKPNSIACERVGIGVSTEIPASLVVVQMAGQVVALSPPAPPQAATTWLGYRQGVSLRNGPLRIPVSTRTDLWYGTPEVYPQVRVTAFFANGQEATATGRVLLHPGFG
jgi:hypothetical protein